MISDRRGTLSKKVSTDLKEADHEADDAVAAQSAGEDLVHAALAEEGLDDENERLESWESGDV